MKRFKPNTRRLLISCAMTLLGALAIAPCRAIAAEESNPAPAGSKTETAAVAEKESLPPQQWGTLKGRFLYDGKAPKPEKFDVSKEPALKTVDVFDESLVV